MSVSILCVGKLKESYFADAVKEYQKRLSRLMPVNIIELPDEREPQMPALPCARPSKRKRASASSPRSPRPPM